MKKKLITEKKISKKAINANKEAIDSYKEYSAIREQIDAVKIAMGKKKVFKTNNNSTRNSKVDFNGIGSTQNIQINTRLA